MLWLTKQDPTTLSQEQKIDYIFTTLQKREQREKIQNIAKWAFRIFLIAYLYYFIMIMLPGMLKDMIPEVPKMPSTENLNLESVKDLFK